MLRTDMRYEMMRDDMQFIDMTERIDMKGCEMTCYVMWNIGMIWKDAKWHATHWYDTSEEFVRLHDKVDLELENSCIIIHSTLMQLLIFARIDLAHSQVPKMEA